MNREREISGGVHKQLRSQRKKGKKEKRTRCGKVVVVCGVAVEGPSFPLCWCLPWAFAFVFVLVVVVEATLPASKDFTSVFLVRDLSSFYRTSCSPSLEQNESTSKEIATLDLIRGFKDKVSLY